MLVSVIIPTFNRCGFVREAVASACAQRGAECEVVVIDDSSTDGTAVALEKEFGAAVRLLSTANRGVAAARNLGVAATRGELMAFLDSDDRGYIRPLLPRLGSSLDDCELLVALVGGNWGLSGISHNLDSHVIAEHLHSGCFAREDERRRRRHPLGAIVNETRSLFRDHDAWRRAPTCVGLVVDGYQG
jgi:glycosyltransferase involved in cell wall biosynthesis